MSSREQVEKTADRLRVELLATLEELERRRQSAMDVRQQLANHVGLAAGVGAAVLALLGGTLAVSLVRRRNRRALGTRERLRGFIRAWEHPDWLARKTQNESPLPAAMARRMALTAASVVAAQAAKQATRSLLPASKQSF